MTRVWVRYAGVRRDTWVEERIIPERLHTLGGRRPRGLQVSCSLSGTAECVWTLKLLTNWLRYFAFSAVHKCNQTTLTLSCKKIEPMKRESQFRTVFFSFLSFLLTPSITLSVGFFTSEGTPGPAWWPQTLSEVTSNSQSSRLWKTHKTKRLITLRFFFLLKKEVWLPPPERMIRMSSKSYQNEVYCLIKPLQREAEINRIVGTITISKKIRAKTISSQRNSDLGQQLRSQMGKTNQWWKSM